MVSCPFILSPLWVELIFFHLSYLSPQLITKTWWASHSGWINSRTFYYLDYLDLLALWFLPRFSIDTIDGHGLSALLIACFFGNLDCVRLLLGASETTISSQSPQPMRISSTTSSLSIDSVETAPGELWDQHFLPPINAFRTAALQWQFLPGGSNLVLLNPQLHMTNKHICGHFNALHIAVMTG